MKQHTSSLKWAFTKMLPMLTIRELEITKTNVKHQTTPLFNNTRKKHFLHKRNL